MGMYQGHKTSIIHRITSLASFVGNINKIFRDQSTRKQRKYYLETVIFAECWDSSSYRRRARSETFWGYRGRARHNYRGLSNLSTVHIEKQSLQIWPLSANSITLDTMALRGGTCNDSSRPRRLLVWKIVNKLSPFQQTVRLQVCIKRIVPINIPGDDNTPPDEQEAGDRVPPRERSDDDKHPSDE